MGSADWTPIRGTAIANQTDAALNPAIKLYAGCQITSGAAATTVLIRHGQLVTSPILFTYKVDTINTTRLFPMPGFVTMQDGIFVDVDANTAEITVLHS